MVLGQLNIHMQKKKKKLLDTAITPFTKINFKWITDPNVKQKIIKCLEHTIGGYRHTFLDTIPKTQSMKEILDKLNFIEIKKLLLCVR